MPIQTLLLTGKKLTDQAGRAAQAMAVATQFASFVTEAATRLDIAIYHFHLAGSEGQAVAQAIEAAVAKGVKVRIAYFDEPQRRSPEESISHDGGDHWGPFDHQAFETIGAETKPIVGIDLNRLPVGVEPEPIEGGGHLMHSKYMVRDGNAVWMGTANFTSEAWSVQDNNVVIVTESPALAKYYQTDFDELWANGRIAGTGRNDTGSLDIGTASAEVTVDVDFSPGDGTTIDQTIAALLAGASHTIHVASMVISSGAVLSALVEAIERGIAVTGVYDGPQMSNVEKDWAKGSATHHDGASNGKAEAWAVVRKKLVGKKSLAYSPGRPDAPYNFMHNKTAVVDEATVITGSFNFSQNATHNAENVLILHDPDLAKAYAGYIEALPKAW